MIAKTRPAVRLRPVPAFDPPYEDEASPDAWGAQVALHRDTRRRRRTRPPVPIPGVTPLAPVSLDTGPPATVPPPASPDAKRATRQFVDTCLEIFNGYRPVGHIRPRTVPAFAEPIIEQLAAGVARTERLRRAQRPPLPARAPGALVRLRRLHVCEPRAGVAEAAAVLGQVGRAWAVAFRLERRRGTWLCTAVRVV
ncbi:Rv3235 family protein [Actinomycetes bacterium KLBMP 9797]